MTRAVTGGMQEPIRLPNAWRIDSEPARSRARNPVFLAAGHDGGLFGPGTGRLFVRRLRAIRRGLAVLLWTFACFLVQGVCLLLPGRPKIVFARVYWATVCRLLGLRVRLVGAPPAGRQGRPVVFVSNHSSWLDVAVLGGRLEACFIAKDDVADWPLVKWVARLGRTVFVSRHRARTGRERDTLRARLDAGDSLILFPEGTTSDGSRVLPFRSSFFAIAEGAGAPLIQPVSVVYDRLGGLPIGRANRPLFAWYGDMDIASHFWRLAQNQGLRASVLLHAPIDPADYADRKALARGVWQAVADGAAALRQNRPTAPVAPPAAADSVQPAFA